LAPEKLVAPASVNSVGIDQMATDLQMAANRRNALLSTGPRSLAGKARSRMNAVSHGLTAQQTLLPGEDPAEYAGLRQSMFNSLGRLPWKMAGGANCQPDVALASLRCSSVFNWLILARLRSA
jgi:hypothetical protein